MLDGRCIPPPTSVEFTQELSEFLATVTRSETESSAATAAVERAADMLDAVVAAIVCDGEVIAAAGPNSSAAVAALHSVMPGQVGCDIIVPGVGSCAATAVALDHPPGARFVVARSGAAGLSIQAMSMLLGMAAMTSMTMRMLRLLASERAARELGDRQMLEIAGLVDEQAALRRVATLVAGQAPADAIFAAVAQEAAQLLGADVGTMSRYEPNELMATIVGTWSESGGGGLPVGTRMPLLRDSVAGRALRLGRAIRLDSHDGTLLDGPLRQMLRKYRIRASVGAPILVDGDVWGFLVASKREPETFAVDTEQRLTGFTDLVATAISNAASREELVASRRRIVAVADDIRRAIERDLHDGIQQRLVTVALQLGAVADTVPTARPDLREPLTQAGAALRGVLDELREISRGVHPAILSEGGLGPALKALARRSAVPVELHLDGVARLSQAVEVAAYYAVAEALTNAAKHAHATAAQVNLRVDGGRLRLAVVDDGVGGADATRGSGIIGLTDRVEALGGSILVRSPAGHGTSMVIELPG
ncbi:MAG TPA: GAF domain-containing protein [Candidatus Dormibacteraeota bacterium]|jgi:signal transduction histidine kinase|nr:GAF domain-containing protein [Candidatus Dormibacteraeota bacterium]